VKGDQFRPDESIEKAGCREMFDMEDALQDELRKPGANAPEGPTDVTSGGSIALDGLSLNNVVQQNTVMLISKRMKRVQFESGMLHLTRRSYKPHGAWDQGEKWMSIVSLSTDRSTNRLVALSTDRLIAYSTGRLITFHHPCRSIHLSRNRAWERKSE